MSYLVTTSFSKAKSYFINQAEFQSELDSHRHQTVKDLLTSAQLSGDLVSTSHAYGEEGDDYVGTIDSNWKDQATYEAYVGDPASQEEIGRIEADGYTMTVSVA